VANDLQVPGLIQDKPRQPVKLYKMLVSSSGPSLLATLSFQMRKPQPARKQGKLNVVINVWVARGHESLPPHPLSFN
jgi:hypothetical protein